VNDTAAGPSERTPRKHIVLVPGFVGFDGLGQLAYYAGVTGVFDRWNCPQGKRGQDASILYFDNFPTASVQLRANRLREYLAIRVARGEFAVGDSLALVGHSTGGLDIRRALFDMARTEDTTHLIDENCVVSHRRILDLIERVVFLSVPQYGTNLADFACRFSSSLQRLASEAAMGLALNSGALGRIRRVVFTSLANSPSNLVLALVDALNESDEDKRATSEQRAAAREARFQLAAWLDNIAHDFAIVDDLRTFASAPKGSASPAHFSPAERRKEIEDWKRHGIKTRSFATRVPANAIRPSRIARSAVAALQRLGPALDLRARFLPRGAMKWLIPPVALASEAARATELASLPFVVELLKRWPSFIFDLFYAACADRRGPFRDPASIAPGSIAPTVHVRATGATLRSDSIAVTDSDGVVNTLSMLWPHDPTDPQAHPIDLVDADHGDVIGHFTLKPKIDPVQPAGRRYFAYDFFQTRFQFTETAFDALWRDVFDFCVGS
jgi:triacylglycerol lipase